MNNSKKKIGNDFFKNITNFGDLKPNGAGKFSFVKYDTNIEEDKYVSNLYLFDMKTERIIDQLTTDGSVGMHEWIDKDNMIISTLIEDKDKEDSDKGIPLSVFYKFNIETKEYTELFRVNKGIYKIERIDDDKYLLLSDDNLMKDQYIKEANGDWNEYVKIVERESRYFIAEEVPFWTNDGGYSNKARGRALIYDRGRILQVSDDGLSVYDIKSFKNKYGIFYGIRCGGIQRSEGELYKIDYDNNTVTPIDNSNKYIYTKIQALDENHILVCRSDRRFHGEYQNEYIDILNLSTGEFTRNNKHADIHLYDNVLNDITYLTGWLNKITVKGDNIVFISTRGGSSKLLTMKKGCDDISVITENEGKILDYFIEDDKIYMSAMRGISAPEFYCLDLKNSKERQISSFNSWLEDEYEFVPIEYCGFEDSDGVDIDGWVMKPLDYSEGQKFPTILFIHGGPESAYGPVLTHEMQVMCSEGYGVIYCNPRGSEGKGGDFGDIRTKWGTVDYDDIMEFVDAAIRENEWIDKDKIGITGGSYGGIMTNWIVSHTNRFQAAISDRSVSNLFSDYCMSDIGFACNKDTYGTTPWDNPELIWEKSPLKHAANIKTPILFIHGVDDYRCPYDHSLQLHSAITFFGGTSRVFAVKGETHELCRSGVPANRVRRIEEMVNWFDRFLK